MGNLSVVKKNYINYIDNVVKSNHISHAYLIEVGNYDDDFNMIIDFIKMILCNISYEELETSDSNIINLIDSNNYPDIKIIETDSNTIKKEQLLNLQKDYNNKSLLENKRIYIIKEAEKLNPASANTILKFLEEPEEDIIAFLVTNNRYNVIDTILSRCQILTLKDNDIIKIEDDSIYDLLGCIINPNKLYVEYNYFVSDVLVDKGITLEKLKKIENILINYLNYKYLDIEINDDKVQLLLENCSVEKILFYISVIEKEVVKLNFNVNFKLWIDSFFSKLVLGG